MKKERGLDGIPGLKDVPLSKLTRLLQFFNERLKAGSSPALMNYLRVVLRIGLNHALKADRLSGGVLEGKEPKAIVVQPRLDF
jgi:hypothetical protein